jgi:hypothetical protein
MSGGGFELSVPLREQGDDSFQFLKFDVYDGPGDPLDRI